MTVFLNYSKPNASLLAQSLILFDFELKKPALNRKQMLFELLDPDLFRIHNKFKHKALIKHSNLSDYDQQRQEDAIVIETESDKQTTSAENKTTTMTSTKLTENELSIYSDNSAAIANISGESSITIGKIKRKNVEQKNKTTLVVRRTLSMPQDNTRKKENTKAKLKNIITKLQTKPLLGQISNTNSLKTVIQRQLSLDSKMNKQTVDRSSITKEQRERAATTIYKNFEKKLANQDTKESKFESVDLAQIADKYEKGIYMHLGENYEKYRTRILAVCSNIAASDNNTFYRKLLIGEITPEVLATMNTLEMASEEKIKERQAQRENDLKERQKYAEDNQKNNKIIKKTHKGEIEIDINKEDTTNACVDQNIENYLPIMPSTGKILFNEIKIDTTKCLSVIGSSDLTIFTSEERNSLTSTLNQSEAKPEVGFEWTGFLKTEIASSPIKVKMLSKLNCKADSFVFNVQNVFFSENTELSLEDCDYYDCKSDLLLQLKHEKLTDELVFVELEASNHPDTHFYSKLYSHLVKIQCVHKKMRCYAKINLSVLHSGFISKFYLFPLKNKHESVDVKLKQNFSINVERNKDLVLGVFISNRVVLKFSDRMNNIHVAKILNDMLKETENDKLTYNFLVLFFSRIIENDYFKNEDYKRSVIFFFSNYKNLCALTDEQRIRLLNQFYDRLPDLVCIVIRSSPNDLMSISSQYDIIQTCSNSTHSEEDRTRDEKSKELAKVEVEDKEIHKNVSNYLSDLEPVSDDEFDAFNGSIKNTIAVQITVDENSDSDIHTNDNLNIVNKSVNGCNDVNSIEHVSSDAESFENKKNINKNKNVEHSSENLQAVNKENKPKKKNRLTDRQNKIFNYYIASFERRMRFKNKSPVNIQNCFTYSKKFNDLEMARLNARKIRFQSDAKYSKIS